MSQNTPLYIMTPALFENLKSVNGFTNLNGNTYKEHICIIFSSALTDEQKINIINKTTCDDALKYLGTIIQYTHEMFPNISWA